MLIHLSLSLNEREKRHLIIITIISQTDTQYKPETQRLYERKKLVFHAEKEPLTSTDEHLQSDAYVYVYRAVKDSYE